MSGSPDIAFLCSYSGIAFLARLVPLVLLPVKRKHCDVSGKRSCVCSAIMKFDPHRMRVAAVRPANSKRLYNARLRESAGGAKFHSC
jgi:hypothetical protein